MTWSVSVSEGKSCVMSVDLFVDKWANLLPHSLFFLIFHCREYARGRRIIDRLGILIIAESEIRWDAQEGKKAIKGVK